jgi:hypothetical protein
MVPETRKCEHEYNFEYFTRRFITIDSNIDQDRTDNKHVDIIDPCVFFEHGFVNMVKNDENPDPYQNRVYEIGHFVAYRPNIIE